MLLSADGSALSFVTQTNGTAMTNLSATINWATNNWHQVVLAYSSTNSSLYIDGQPAVTNGIGVDRYPDATLRANGFYIGSDHAGGNQAAGQFDELETFHFQMDAASVSANFNLIDPQHAETYENRGKITKNDCFAYFRAISS